MKTVRAVGAILKVRLGDRRTRVKDGERKTPSSSSSSSSSYSHNDSCKDKDQESRPNGYSKRRLLLLWAEWPDNALLGGLSPGEHRPTRPPLGGTTPSNHALPPGVEPKNCYFVGRGDIDGGCVELRRVCFASSDGDVSRESDLKDSVVVLREGLALLKISLLELVNTVYAVLVLRGAPDTLNSSSRGYHYLHNDFALRAEEEDSSVEWGVGRRLYAGILLAVGGLLLEALAEQVWGPAVVGVLLVATAEIRVSGVLTNIIRVRSVGWKRCQLVPSGSHGTKRTVQLVLITALALAVLLGSKELLLAKSMWVAAIFPFALLVWVGDVFAGASTIFCVAGVFWLTARARLKSAFGARTGLMVLVIGLFCAVVWAPALDVTQTDLKMYCFPWKWPLTEAPRDLKSALGLPGMWIVVILDCVFAVNVVVEFCLTENAQRQHTP